MCDNSERLIITMYMLLFVILSSFVVRFARMVITISPSVIDRDIEIASYIQVRSGLAYNGLLWTLPCILLDVQFSNFIILGLGLYLALSL